MFDELLYILYKNLLLLYYSYYGNLVALHIIIIYYVTLLGLYPFE